MKSSWGPMIKVALGLFVAGAVCGQAAAGEYVVEYEGGRFKVDPIDYSTRPNPTPKPTYYQAYVDLDDGVYGGSGTPIIILIIGGLPCIAFYGGSVEAGEEITATFTWVGEEGEDPPPAVVVKEECTASFRGTNGSRSTTLRVIASTTNQETGERYSLVENPGDSFEVKCTPTASNTTTANSPGPVVSISYKAQACSADIVLGGGIGPNGAKQYLIGQRLTASLSCPLTPVSYQWSVNGGEPYAEFAITPTTGHRVAVAAATTTSAQYSACFAKEQDPVRITLVARFGTAGSGDDLTIRKQFVTVKPTFTVVEAAAPSQIALTSDGLGWIFTGTFDPEQPEAGMQGFGVRAKLEVPAEFKAEGVSGDWNWAQVLTTNYTRLKGGKTERNYFQSELPDGTKVDYTTGHDGGFAYNTCWPLYDRDLLSPFGGERRGSLARRTGPEGHLRQMRRHLRRWGSRADSIQCGLCVRGFPDVLARRHRKPTRPAPQIQVGFLWRLH